MGRMFDKREIRSISTSSCACRDLRRVCRVMVGRQPSRADHAATAARRRTAYRWNKVTLRVGTTTLKGDSTL
jgi:hypothetical protein